MAKKNKKTKEYRKPAQFRTDPDPVVNPTAVRSEAKAQSNAMVLISAGLASSVLLFFYYHFWTLGQLTESSGGLAMPDQRIFGFTVEQITELRSVMSPEAIDQLAYVHRTVGMFFPLLFGFFSLLTLGQWISDRVRRWVAWSVPLLFVIVDLWGNRVIDSLFRGELDAAAVTLASTLTIGRWVLLIATAIILLVLGLRRFNRTLKQKLHEAREGM